jgi:hypothetical protein
MSWNQIVKINPKLAGIKEVLKPKPFTEEERAQHQRFKKGISDNEFKTLSYEDKKAYLDIYPTIAKPITTKQFLMLPEDLKNLYVSFGIGLDDEQFESIKNNPKLVKRYAQISDRKLDNYINVDGYTRRQLRMMYTELIVLPDNRISEYLNTLNKKQIGNFIAINGVDKLEMLEKHASSKLVNNYSDIKPMIQGLQAGNDNWAEELSEKLPEGVDATLDIYGNIIFELPNNFKFNYGLEDLMGTLSTNGWSSWNDSYFEGWEDGLDEEYNANIESALTDQSLVTALRKNGLNPTPEIVSSLLEKFKFTEPIKEFIDELFTEAQTESEDEVFDSYHDKFTDIITYEDNSNSYYGSSFKEITIKLKNFIGALISDSDILTTDKTDFETAFESLLEDMLEQADIPSSYDELSERVREGGNMNVDTDKIVQRIKDDIYEIIDEKMYDDDEEYSDYDTDEIENLKKTKYDILTAFEKTLKGLGQDENASEIENELVRIVFDRSKLKTNGSIYTSVIHKEDNKTYNGFMFIKDIPSYFKNYKLFEVLKNFKKLIN